MSALYGMATSPGSRRLQVNSSHSRGLLGLSSSPPASLHCDWSMPAWWLYIRLSPLDQRNSKCKWPEAEHLGVWNKEAGSQVCWDRMNKKDEKEGGVEEMSDSVEPQRPLEELWVLPWDKKSVLNQGGTWSYLCFGKDSLAAVLRMYLGNAAGSRV